MGTRSLGFQKTSPRKKRLDTSDFHSPEDDLHEVNKCLMLTADVVQISVRRPSVLETHKQPLHFGYC